MEHLYSLVKCVSYVLFGSHLLGIVALYEMGVSMQTCLAVWRRGKWQEVKITQLCRHCSTYPLPAYTNRLVKSFVPSVGEGKT